MANIFDQFDETAPPPQVPAGVPAPKGRKNVFDQFDAGAKPAYSGSILPFSRAQDGTVSFDSNAGLLGAIKHALGNAATLPGDVYAGRVDPMSEEGLDRARDMAGVISPVNPGIRAGDKIIPGVGSALERQRVTPPSAAALKRTAGQQYDAVRDMGVDYSSDAVGQVARGVKAALERDGLLAENAPTAHRILDKLTSPPADSVAPIQNIDSARKAIGHVRGKFAEPAEQEAARRISDALDEFIQVAPGREGAVVAGPASEAAETIVKARGNYAASKRSDTLNGIEDTADLRAAVANSGLNLDNAIRSRVASLLTDPKKIAGFSEAEQAALREVAEGTATRNTFRRVGNLLGGGGGLGAIVTGGAGAMAGNQFGLIPGVVAGAALPAAGLASKVTGNALTRKALNSADELVRTRSPLYEEMQLTPPYARPNLDLPAPLALGSATPKAADPAPEMDKASHNRVNAIARIIRAGQGNAPSARRMINALSPEEREVLDRLTGPMAIKVGPSGTI
jgi:hypothetical protein